MATILCQGFDDCNSLRSAMKVRGAHRWGWALGAAGTQTRSGAVGTGGAHSSPSAGACVLPPQLVHMFSSLLERPLLRAAVSPQCSGLLATFSAELDDVKRLFDMWTRAGAAVPVHTNMPPVAGQLQWALELQERLQGTHQELFAINHPYVRFSPSAMGMWGRICPSYGSCLLCL